MPRFQFVLSVVMTSHARVVLTALIALAIGSDAPAADLYWSGVGTWDTSAQNWSTTPGGPYDQAIWNNAAADAATFEGTAGSVTLGGPITAASVTFGVDGYTITGDTLTLAGTPSVTLGSGLSATIASVIAGSSGLTKAGAGSLSLTAANTYTGVTTISAGTLVLSSAQNGTTSGPLGASGTISLTGGTLR